MRVSWAAQMQEIARAPSVAAATSQKRPTANTALTKGAEQRVSTAQHRAWRARAPALKRNARVLRGLLQRQGMALLGSCCRPPGGGCLGLPSRRFPCCRKLILRWDGADCCFGEDDGLARRVRSACLAASGVRVVWRPSAKLAVQHDRLSFFAAKRWCQGGWPISAPKPGCAPALDGGRTGQSQTALPCDAGKGLPAGIQVARRLLRHRMTALVQAMFMRRRRRRQARGRRRSALEGRPFARSVAPWRREGWTGGQRAAGC